MLHICNTPKQKKNKKQQQSPPHKKQPKILFLTWHGPCVGWPNFSSNPLELVVQTNLFIHRKTGPIGNVVLAGFPKNGVGVHFIWATDCHLKLSAHHFLAMGASCSRFMCVVIFIIGFMWVIHNIWSILSPFWFPKRTKFKARADNVLGNSVLRCRQKLWTKRGFTLDQTGLGWPGLGSVADNFLLGGKGK